MTIGILLDSRFLGGAEKRALAIAAALNDREVPCSLLVNEETKKQLGAGFARFPSLPVSVYRDLGWRGWLGVGLRQFGMARHFPWLDRIECEIGRAWWRSEKQFRDITLLHVFLRPQVLRFFRGPQVFEVTSPDVAKRILAVPELIPRRTVLHCVSESVAARLGTAFPFNRKVVAPIPFFQTRSDEHRPCRSKENLIVFGHRWIPRKNPILFARAAKRFVAARPDWRVLIRGQGPLESELRSVLKNELASGTIELGYNADLREELERSRIFVSLIEQDNYPSQSLVEAMWCRNAVVLSDRGSTRARLFANNGVVCKIDEEQVFNGLMRLAGDEDWIEECGENSRRHVAENFDASLYLDHLLDVYALARKLVAS